MEKGKWKEIGNFTLLLAIVIVTVYLLSNFIGLSQTGFEAEEVLGLQTFYLIGGLFGLGLFCLKVYEISDREGDEKYGSSVGFANIGKKPHLPIFKRFNGVQLFLLSLILFTIMGLLNSLVFSQFTGQQSFTGVGLLETQQFTQTDSLIYSTLLIPGAENLGFALMLGFFLTLFRLIAKKTKLDFQSYQIIYFALSFLIGGGFGYGNHLLRYPGSEIALFTVFMFWAIGGLITAVTGSFIPFWVMHMDNNFFVDIQRTFSSSSTSIVVIVFIIAIGIIYYLLFKKNLFGKKSNET